MTDQHPLTNKDLEDLEKLLTSSVLGQLVLPSDFELARAAADWQLEQCIAWLDDTDCDNPQETAQRLREAMRPQEDS